MRKNQVSITISRFGGEVPKKLGAGKLEITVYADGNNVYEALAATYYEALAAVGMYKGLPSLGRRQHTQKAFRKKDNGGWDIVYDYDSENNG